MPDGGDGRAGPGGSGAAPAALALRDRDVGVSFVRFAPRAPFDPRILLWGAQDAPGAAAFRLLRQRLIERNDPRIILCTSANPGEGKTTLAANLALAYAELGRHRVLLVEASFRAASLGELFGFKPPAGFALQLTRHRARPEDPWVVVQIGAQPLFVMAADPRCCTQCASTLPEDAQFCGHCGATARQLASDTLDAVSFLAAVQRLRDTFDYLIIDAPPVLAGGDVNMIQDIADAVVFATRKGSSDQQELRRAVEQVSPAPVTAVALIDG